jgi:anti-anti-sigma regulatory factor
MNKILQKIRDISIDNCNDLYKKITHLLEQKSEVEVCLTLVENIDLAGFNTIVKLRNFALQNNCQLTIIGSKNPELRKFLDVTQMDFLMND